jgi:c-di-GMP-binding flagellar brake protein YcgR
MAYIKAVGERMSMQDINKFLSIGAKIHLLIMNDNNQSQYVSRVDNINEDTVLKVIITKEAAIYEFKAEIENKLFGVDPLLRLKRTSDIQKIQRRNYFRLKSLNTIKIRKIVNLKEAIFSEYFNATMVDISGGGLAFNSELELDINDLIEISVTLNSNTINLLGMVVRADRSEDNLKKMGYGINFEKITETERNIIMSFIFEEQRKLVKKGLI